MLAAPAAVLKGEQAIAEYHDGAVWLSLPVIAERNGRIGEVIRVRNPASHKMLLAQVIGEGRVLIESGSRADLNHGTSHEIHESRSFCCPACFAPATTKKKKQAPTAAALPARTIHPGSACTATTR